MTAKVLKRSRAKFVSKEIVDQMGLTLQELPEKTPDTLSLRQTIERLRDPIEAALAKGYNYEELVPMLAQQGINIQPSTLKRYVLSGGDRANRKRGAVGKTRTRRSRQSAEDTAPAESEAAPLMVELSDEPDEAPESEPRKRGRAAKSSTASAAKTSTRGRSRQAETEDDAKPKARSTSTRRGRGAK